MVIPMLIGGTTIAEDDLSTERKPSARRRPAVLHRDWHYRLDRKEGEIGTYTEHGALALQFAILHALSVCLMLPHCRLTAHDLGDYNANQP